MVMRYPHKMMSYKMKDWRGNIQDRIIIQYRDYLSQRRSRQMFLERKRMLFDVWQHKNKWILPDEEIELIIDVERDEPLLDHRNFNNSWCWWGPGYEMDRQYYQEWLEYFKKRNEEQCIIRRKKQGGYDWLIDPYRFNYDINLVFNLTYRDRKVDKVTGIISLT